MTPPELFASIIGTHFLDTYNHTDVCHVNIIMHRWTRMTVDGQPHPHSFYRDGEETRVVEAVARKGHGITMTSGIKNLLVLKARALHATDFTAISTRLCLRQGTAF